MNAVTSQRSVACALHCRICHFGVPLQDTFIDSLFQNHFISSLRHDSLHCLSRAFLSGNSYDIDRPLFHVIRQNIPGLYIGNRASDRGLRRDVADCGTSCGTGKSPVCDQRNMSVQTMRGPSYRITRISPGLISLFTTATCASSSQSNTTARPL